MELQQPKISGVWLVFFAALCWSINTPLVKFIQLDSIFLAGLRALVAGVFLAPFIRPKQLEWNRWLVIYSLSYCLISLNLIICLKMTSAAIAVGMQYTSAIWLFLLALLQKQKFRPITYVSIGIIIAGVVLFMMDDSAQSNTLGNLLTITEGIFFGILTYSAKKVGNMNPISVTAVANLASALLIFLFLPPKFSDLLTIPLSTWPLLLILGIVQVGGGYTLFNIGSRYISPQKASIIALWEILLGPLWVAIFLKEYQSTIVLVGLLIIFIGIVLYTLSEKKKVPTLKAC